jgi:hypothetical protein
LIHLDNRLVWQSTEFNAGADRPAVPLGMPFKPVTSGTPVPKSPLELFDELPRMAGAVPELWRQQGDVLREYMRAFDQKPDVAIELPTGTGKTIVGLLLAEWRRRRYNKPVIYACPTNQLAYQVAAAAGREGVQAVTLLGSSTKWDAVDHTRYEAAEALGLTVYSHVFNASPKIGLPGTLLFDDAHAAEQFVAQSWSILVNRFDQPDTYRALRDVLGDGLDEMFLQRLGEQSTDARTYHDVRLVVPSRRSGMLARVDAALETLPEGSGPWWALRSARPGLASCLVYVSWLEILIRPFVPPTAENTPFSSATQRIYLSATLGHAGELERSFGRPKIDRLPLPGDGRNPRSGRRFFIFTDLTRGDQNELASAITHRAGKALLLGKSTEEAVGAANLLNPDGWPILGKDDVERTLEPFAKAEHAILALAGRYDGLDLPNDACRLVVIDGLPDFAHAQERFLASNLRARIALEERTRTRVVQGVGRATRNPSDHAIVVVRGILLTRYLSNPDVRAALDPDMQAEINFGRRNSEDTARDELLENVDSFLEQNIDWRDGAEPMINDARRGLERIDPDGSELLARSAPYEVEASLFAFRRDYVGARESAIRAAQELQGLEVVRSYRGFWLYLAAVWSFQAMDRDPNAGKTGAGLLAEAQKAAQAASWIRETDPGDVQVEDDANDSPAIQEISRRLASGLTRAKVQEAVVRMKSGLAAVEHQKSEPALTEMGNLLGAEAYKPGGQARPDSVWCWGQRIWIALEAKSEEQSDGELPVRDVRQANTQLQQVQDDRGVGSPLVAADIIISPRTMIADEAITQALAHVHLVHPDIIRDLSGDIASFWEQLMIRRAGHSGHDLDHLIRTLMASYQVLPTQVFERLTVDPIRTY